MSFLSRLGLGHKKEDFSLDQNLPPLDSPMPNTQNTSSDPFANTSQFPQQSSDSFNSQFSDPLQHPSFSDPSQSASKSFDPMSPSSSADANPAFPSFQKQDSSSSTSSSDLPPEQNYGVSQSVAQPRDNFPPTRGQELARNHMQNEFQSSPTNDPLEIINLKLDAIRSEITSLSHRVHSLEQHLGDKKRGW